MEILHTDVREYSVNQCASVLCLGHLLSQENMSGVLTEVPPLISESDLHISQVWISGVVKNAK